uniref:PS II complex 12 kDa extrinsic protein n=1 Tax=Pseudo-nitzschia delicatissima TaxID=44447 RepID=A0A6T9Z9K7_9STRA|mmetsp:Transcript_1271/g.2606  ORF Transcript_1271/g.2606 Transcript_1271/m.2606 type:complete len:176 (+) Transcript_1271:243-770(+)
MMQVLFAILFICVMSFEATAFVSQSSSSTSTELNAMGRREAMFGIASALVAGTVAAPQEAEAKYSDYARREEDWENRKKSGDIKVSSAKDLRTQLAEIVPQNSEGSKIFCPNGASAAVSPLMENKCSDTRMAIPSVYGRSNDSAGNSIPGFKGGYAWGPGESSSISAAVGGFPTY